MRSQALYHHPVAVLRPRIFRTQAILFETDEREAFQRSYYICLLLQMIGSGKYHSSRHQRQIDHSNMIERLIHRLMRHAGRKGFASGQNE